MGNGFRQTINDLGKPGYSDPCPPRGDEPRHYHFRLSALSEPSLPVGPSATCVELIAMAAPYVLEFVELVALYQRRMKPARGKMECDDAQTSEVIQISAKSEESHTPR